MSTESTTGVTLPDDGVIDTNWMKEQLLRVDLFSQELLNYGKGQVFFMAQSNLSDEGFEQSIGELGYTVETAMVYIRYLQKKPVLEAIKEKYYTALSLSAADIIPDSVDDALALCDVCVAKYGKLTADNLTKAAEDSGTPITKMSDAAVGIEATKKKLLAEWLLSMYEMSQDDILNAARIKPEGKQEFLEQSLNAYDRLGTWENFYKVIAKAVHDNGDAKIMRFLADLNNASQSIEEYLKSETNFKTLEARKEQFYNTVYPEMMLEEELKA